jgi:hypothetical protein
MLRIGDLVLYGTVAPELGVFLEEEVRRNGPNNHKYNLFWNAVSGKMARTVVDFDLLTRVPLPDDPRSTPARGDPT